MVEQHTHLCHLIARLPTPVWLPTSGAEDFVFITRNRRIHGVVPARPGGTVKTARRHDYKLISSVRIFPSGGNPCPDTFKRVCRFEFVGFCHGSPNGTSNGRSSQSPQNNGRCPSIAMPYLRPQNTPEHTANHHTRFFLLALVSRAAKQQDCVQCTNPPHLIRPMTLSPYTLKSLVIYRRQLGVSLPGLAMGPVDKCQ